MSTTNKAGEAETQEPIHEPCVSCYQDGESSGYADWQMMLKEYFDIDAEEPTELKGMLERASLDARIEELKNFANPQCLCNEMGTEKCDDYWHHENAVADRIAELEKQRSLLS